MQQVGVELQDVTKAYASGTVIHSLSLKIPANITTAVVGESGSGKSTLLQLINGLVLPDTGRIFLQGIGLDYARLAKIRRTMGYVVQGAGLFPNLTVQENVTLLATLGKWPPERISARFRYLFDLLKLPLGFADRYPYSLSGGQQQRVSLCRAMMLSPPLLLLDEPFSALDPITRAGIHEEFVRLHQVESRTILLVTHDMFEAIKLAQHLVILKAGQVVQADKLAAVVQHPVNDYVAKLLDSRDP